MRHRTIASRPLLAVLLTAGALSLGGCFARLRTQPIYAGATVTTGYAGDGVVVYQAPPQPQVVVATPPPVPYQGAVWVQGHWQWSGAQYVWVDGNYIQPRVGYVYVQPRWQRRGTGYVYAGGGWRAHRARVRARRRYRRRGGGVLVQPARVGPRRGRVRVRGSAGARVQVR